MVFIAGSQRSGSTLACRLLSTVSDGLAVGELREVISAMHARQSCSCGQASDACSVWGPIMADLGQTWTAEEQLQLEAQLNAEFRIRTFSAGRVAKGSSSESLDLFRRLMAGLHHAASGRPVVDSSKSVAVLARHLAAGVSQPRTVHLLRDPRAVGFSQWASKAGVSRRDDEPPGFGTLQSSVQWAAWNTQIVALVPGLTPYRQVWYEDIVMRPEVAVTGLLEGLGVGVARPVEIDPDGTVELDPGHLLVGNPSRGLPRRARLCLDERWRDQSTLSRRIATSLITGVPRAALTRRRGANREHMAPGASSTG